MELFVRIYLKISGTRLTIYLSKVVLDFTKSKLQMREVWVNIIIRLCRTEGEI